jgi:hypothetical protein
MRLPERKKIFLVKEGQKKFESGELCGMLQKWDPEVQWSFLFLISVIIIINIYTAMGCNKHSLFHASLFSNTYLPLCFTPFLSYSLLTSPSYFVHNLYICSYLILMFNAAPGIWYILCVSQQYVVIVIKLACDELMPSTVAWNCGSVQSVLMFDRHCIYVLMQCCSQ